MSQRLKSRSFIWPGVLMLVAIVAMFGLALWHLPVPASALQIRPARTGTSLPDGFYVYQSLSQRGIHIKSITPLNDGLVVQLDSSSERKLAEEALQDILPPGFMIQYYEQPTAKAWIHKLDRDRLKFG